MLRVLDNPPERRVPRHLATAEAVEHGPGFHAAEREHFREYRWMGLEGRLALPPADEIRYLELLVLSEFHDLSQTLAAVLEQGGDDVAAPRRPLPPGWTRLSLPVPAGTDAATLRLNKLFPRQYYPADGRALGIRVAEPRLHRDAERHRHVETKYDNRVRNLSEMRQGRKVLDSFPAALGIDMHGVCNVKPPCVYCDWDTSKEVEGRYVDEPFSRETVEEWGEFFDGASELINCSVGEPFMMKNVDELLDLFGERDKFLEVTTNGQILTDRNIAKLLGRDIHLYISLDAATAETYAKLRNDTFDRLLHNIRRLVKAKGGRGQRPLIFLVFMPMKVNRHEVDRFVELCAELEADRLILRPLDWAENEHLVWDRAGHHFDYREQLLPFEELVTISGRVAALCEHHGVPLSDQLDFGGSMQSLFAEAFAAARAEVGTEMGRGSGEAPRDGGQLEGESGSERASPAVDGGVDSPSGEPDGPPPSLGTEGLPICQEPWKSLYILRRGVFPCCYGSRPIADMKDYREAWSSPTLQAIRGALAEGRFHRYCLDSPACPIVRKCTQGGVQLLAESRHHWLVRSWRSFDRWGWGIPGKLLRPVKPLLRPVVAALS